MYKQELEQKLDKTIENLNERYTSIIATGANPNMLNSVKVEAYGDLMPLNQVANVTVQDATTLIVTPFDKALTKDIHTAISSSDLNLSSVEEGDKVRVAIPAMTEEKRQAYVKDAKAIGEEAKVSVRNARADVNKKVKANAGSENEEKILLDELQTVVDNYNKQIDEIVETKVNSLLKV